MKHFIIIILLLAAIPACDLQYGTCDEDNIVVGNIYDYDFKGSEEIPEFETVEEVFKYMYFKTSYISDYTLFNQEDYWQTPQDFFYNRNFENLMQGDCEDFALFAGYILYFRMGYKNVNLVRTKEDLGNHIIIHCDGKYIEQNITAYPIIHDPKKINIISEIPYTQALWMAVNYHDSVGEYR